MKLCELLNIQKGVTALVGSGGKTTAMYRLAQELAESGSVVCTTTTHIWPPDRLPENCTCLGTPTPEGKLTAPQIPPERWPELADYILVEADGSRSLPLKAHLPNEPVIPPLANQTILLAGASGFGRPVREVVHRWERFCQLSGARPEEPAAVEHVASVLSAEGIGDKIFINQTNPASVQARRLAAALDRPVFAGEIQGGIWTCLS